MKRLLVHEPDVPAALLDQLWENPDELIEQGTMLKAGDRCTVATLKVEDGAGDGNPGVTGSTPSVVIKRYNLRGRLHTAGHWLLRSRARWSWLNGRRLRAGGLRSPRPLAYVEERFGACRGRSFLVTNYQPGRTMFDLIHRDRINGTQLAGLATQFAEIWRGLERLRLGHGDMKATNFIVDEQRQVWLVDLDAMRTYPRGPLLKNRRQSDLWRFMRNWQDASPAAAAFRDALGIDDPHAE